MFCTLEFESHNVDSSANILPFYVKLPIYDSMKAQKLELNEHLVLCLQRFIQLELVIGPFDVLHLIEVHFSNFLGM